MASEAVSRSTNGGGRDLRADLLLTSRQLLDDGGPSALSMREVARRAGCTHQAPYHYFANREAILAEVVREGFEELADRLCAVHDAREVEGLRQTVTASGNVYVEFALRNPGVFRVMFRPDMCDPQRYPEVGRASERARGELRRLARMVAGGDTGPASEAIFWAGVHGLASLLLDGPLAGEYPSLEERLEFARRVIRMETGHLTGLQSPSEEGGTAH